MGKHNADAQLYAVLGALEDGPLLEADLWEHGQVTQSAITAARGDRYITGMAGGKLKLTGHGKAKLAQLKKG
jgi:hypothetical protein